jgi:hypothetical protein
VRYASDMAKKKQPATVLIGARVERELVDRIDDAAAWRSQHSIGPRWSRSDMIRQLLLTAVEGEEVAQGETESKEAKP